MCIFPHFKTPPRQPKKCLLWVLGFLIISLYLHYVCFEEGGGKIIFGDVSNRNQVERIQNFQGEFKSDLQMVHIGFVPQHPSVAEVECVQRFGLSTLRVVKISAQLDCFHFSIIPTAHISRTKYFRQIRLENSDSASKDTSKAVLDYLSILTNK